MGERKDAGVVKSFVERDGEWLSWEGTVIDGPITAVPIPVPQPLVVATAAEVASLRAEVAALKARVEALESNPLPCPFHSDGKHRCIGCGDIQT